MPRAWSIEELRRFEEIKQGLRTPQQRAAAARRPATPARPRRDASRRPSDPRAQHESE